MAIVGRATARAYPLWIPRWFLLIIVVAGSLLAQSQPQPASAPANSPSAAAPAITPLPSAVHAVLQLDGPWQFNIGDDSRWADPNFDDSSWRPVNTSQSLFDQGIETYAGYAWYRMRLQPQQLAQFNLLKDDPLLALLVSSDNVGQLAVFVNGNQAAFTRGMTDRPSMYRSPPFMVPLAGADTSKPIVLVIRTWAGDGVSTRRGLLTNVELGSESDIATHFATSKAQRWDENAASALIVSFLYFCVAFLGVALLLAQRHHREYLWMTLLCLTVSMGAASDVAFGLGLMPMSVYRIFVLFTGRIFIAVTIEFVLRFSATKPHRLVRFFQIAVLVLPFVYFLHVQQVYDVLSVTAEFLYCGLTCFLLFRAWRGGRGDAGVMLVPFVLVALADSADIIVEYAAQLHWLPERFLSPRFHLGPVEFGTGTVDYLVFLASLIAVILYRFIGVSQVEQQSNAEIAAARSVQALLIPTQLPSTRNFMLESAYLPIHGVGGDFFQVLPLKDDSLLIVVGDVSGKGLQAAMNSSTLVGALRNELSHDPATVLQHLNHVLLGAVSAPGALPGLDSAPCFATCLCARVYPDGELVIANAGHLGPYRDGRELELLPGLPLGVLADSQYEQTNFQLDHGDRLVFLSDGVVEAQNAEGELFGFDRTQQVSNEPARYIAQTAQRFGQTDDITVVSIYVASRTARRDTSELSHLK
jgi:sigma-B regulation protein RsbU (phosphoserine phosphatase)